MYKYFRRTSLQCHILHFISHRVFRERRRADERVSVTDVLCPSVSPQPGRRLLQGGGRGAAAGGQLPAGGGQRGRPPVPILPGALLHHRWGLGHSVLQPQVNGSWYLIPFQIISVC